MPINRDIVEYSFEIAFQDETKIDHEENLRQIRLNLERDGFFVDLVAWRKVGEVEDGVFYHV